MKRKNTFGLNISTLANLNYDSYPMVELSPSKLNIISAYAGNSYNGLKRKYNEKRFKKITEYKDAYIAFLKDIRSKNPDAHIICSLGIMGQDLYPSIESFLLKSRFCR